jgi:hypothetical protein
MQWNATTFDLQVVQPALRAIELYSPTADQLVLGTAIQESELATTTQHGGGPALGYFQMEPLTHNDIWTNFLRYRQSLADKIKALLGTGQQPAPGLLLTNNLYAAAMCRTLYYRVSEPLPAVNDIPAMARYWKDHYNTSRGAGTIDEYVLHWNQFTAPAAPKN